VGTFLVTTMTLSSSAGVRLPDDGDGGNDVFFPKGASARPSPGSSLEAIAKDRHYAKSEKVPFDEDREHEFKQLHNGAATVFANPNSTPRSRFRSHVHAHARHTHMTQHPHTHAVDKPVKRIADYCGKYINAFLNTNGGVCYFGIDDDGVVYGVHLSRSDRDAIRLHVDGIVESFWPAVDTRTCAIVFVPVADPWYHLRATPHSFSGGRRA
jgi:hypothetical protein